MIKLEDGIRQIFIFRSFRTQKCPYSVGSSGGAVERVVWVASGGLCGYVGRTGISISLGVYYVDGRVEKMKNICWSPFTNPRRIYTACAVYVSVLKSILSTDRVFFIKVIEFGTYMAGHRLLII